MSTRCVVIESPYKGDVERNEAYGRKCLFDSLSRGEAPFMGHLLYTQVWDDTDPEQRRKGINAHCAWIDKCDAVIIYNDLGISDGMIKAIDYARHQGKPIEHRSVHNEAG